MPYVCRICGLQFPRGASETDFEGHVRRCVRQHEDYIDSCRHAGQPFEGDPELALFARQEGNVYNRRAGTRRRPR